jgi:hypothetical protein
MVLLDLLPMHTLGRTNKLFPDDQHVTRLDGGDTHRYTYGELYERTDQLPRA